MPLYFFDRIENGELSRGEHGMEFAMLEDARRDAVRALTEIARDEPPDGSDDCELVIYVREDDGPPVLSVSLSLRVKMEEEHHANACPCRKSDPDIMVMQSAEDRQRKNAPGGMDASRHR